MKSVLPALALAGVALLPGCASVPSGGSVTTDLTQVIEAVDQGLIQGCSVYNGFLPTAQSIESIIEAADPALVIPGAAVATGQAIASAICKQLATVPATSFAKGVPHITIDNVPVVLVPASSPKVRGF